MAIILLNGQDRRSITLETSKGTKIDNYQIFEISQFEKNQFADYSKQNYPFAIFRNSPSPIYNCHGMSFACRRTNIDRSTDIRVILSDDQYQKIDIKATLPGDFVLYINSNDGDIAHSGTIVSCEHPENNISRIIVVSKWGKFREVVHDLNDCPYKGLEKEFYRITHTEYEHAN
jgi:hypothetical protein